MSRKMFGGHISSGSPLLVGFNFGVPVRGGTIFVTSGILGIIIALSKNFNTFYYKMPTRYDMTSKIFLGLLKDVYFIKQPKKKIARSLALP